MANPSSTSSKRLVGLGLRGIRNSPLTQVTAQIKSVLSHHSPRTSPTLSSSPTSPKNTINANAASPATAMTAMTPSSSSITSTGVVSPNPRLRTCGRLRSFQGTLAGTNSNATASISGAVGGTRSSPLIESFTPTGLGLSIPNVTSGKQKGVTRLTGPIPAKVDGAGDIEGVVNKTSSGAPCQAIDGRYGVERLNGTDDGVLGISATPATNTYPGSGPGSSSELCLSVGGDLGDIADNISPEGAHGDDTRDLAQHVQDSRENLATPADNGPEQRPLRTPQVRSRVRSRTPSYARTPIQQGLEFDSQNSSDLYGSGSPRLGPTASPTVSTRLTAHPFVEIPFPLHPEKTFRIHTSPLVGSPVNSAGAQLETPGPPDVAPPPSITSLTSSALPTSVSCPFPSASSSGTRLSPKLSAAFKNLKEFTSTLPHRFSLPFSGTTAARSATTPRRNSITNSDNTDSELTLSPNTRRRMFNPINEDMYKSPPSPCSGISSSPRPPSPERSPSSVTLLSSRVYWLRRGEKDEEDEGHREANYSTMCLPSSSPFLHRRATSMSPSPRLSPGRTRSGYSSPVAKIETILGPRERGIDCIPETRDYQCSYSKLRMSPGSLTPLEEDKSLDLNAFMDEIGSRSLGDNKELSLNLSSEELGLRSGPCGVSGGNRGSHAPQQSVSGLPVTSSPTSGPGPAGLAFNLGSGAKAVATTRAGLRRRVTGVSSPLTQCVATWDNVPDQSLSHGGGVEFEGDEDHETSMSPVLMRAKDSLLLKDVQRKKKRTVSISGAEEIAELMGQVIEGIPVSISAPPGAKRCISSDQISTISSDSDAEESVSLLRTSDKMHSSSPNPFRSPPQSMPLVEVGALTPLTPAAPIRPPETPTIRPSTRTASGSRDLDDAISPLQLSSPTFPLTAIVKDSAWVQAPLAASNSFNLGTLGAAPEPRQQRATCA